MGLIGGAIGGFLASLFGLAATGMAVTVIPGTLLYLNDQLPLYILCNVVAMAVAFVLTWMFGYKDKLPETAPEADSSEKIASSDTASPSTRPRTLEILAPITGTAVLLDTVPDPAFAQKHMGEGIAIEPSEGRAFAPFDGTVALVMDKSKHAVILEHASGVQILIHIGINTVSLKGSGFTTHVQTGDRVKAGQLLIEFDIEAIRNAGLPLVTPVLVPSGLDQVTGVTTNLVGNVTANERSIMTVHLA
ncbi:PTS system glucose-specific EIICBA component [compost metagenome]